MKMTWKPWPKRASLSSAFGSLTAVAAKARKIGAEISVYVWKTGKVVFSHTRKYSKDFFARRFNGAAILVTVGAAIVSLSVAAIYRPAGGILWGLFIILAAIDMRR